MKMDVREVVRGVLVALLAALPAVACSSSSSGENASAFDCNVCNVPSFSCTVGTSTATATVPTVTATGCSGTIVSPQDGDVPLFIHCDSGRVCVEHADECFVATSTGTSFSYEIESKGTTVTCTAS